MSQNDHASPPASPRQRGDRGGVATSSTFGLMVLTLLRIAVGWHFLYEGLVKLWSPTWTSASFLRSSQWVLGDALRSLASNSAAIRVVDALNVWGLMVIGLALMLGLLTRLAAVFGGLLLALYYVAHPPLVGLDAGVPMVGHYLIVDKNVVEFLALCVVAALPTGRFMGLDRLLAGLWQRRRARAADGGVVVSLGAAEQAVSRDPLGRRAVLASLTGVPFVGAFVLAALDKRGWESHEEKLLAAKAGSDGEAAAKPATKVDAVSAATLKTFKFTNRDALKGRIPHAKIGTVDLSRVILGGNLIGGWAHARDLIYVSKLVKAYHTKWKVFETFALAEECGVNTFLANPVLCGIIDEYWKRGLGKIQFISDCGGRDLLKMVQKSIDAGACACYIQGGVADGLVLRKKFDLIARALDLIRKNKLPAGIGGHKLATIKGCVEQGLEPDFWMKTIHHTNYWSAKPEQQCDNIWCEKPEETIAFMKGLPQPWIAFKTLAAGAIRPYEGFQFAFQGGADFLCVGMYDFQIVEDINFALDILNGKPKRDRPWRA